MTATCNVHLQRELIPVSFLGRYLGSVAIKYGKLRAYQVYICGHAGGLLSPGAPVLRCEGRVRGAAGARGMMAFDRTEHLGLALLQVWYRRLPRYPPRHY